ncbi:hypothetical protein [Streptomyces sp. NPDC057460]|uniref:hypothetical protein n=1 Tax=Streptomyces sp. NPDC057460 TaxID=3346141 RepID=UPI0036CCFB98
MRPSEENGTGDDDALLRAVAHGDAAALATLYDRHAGRLFARPSRRCTHVRGRPRSVPPAGRLGRLLPGLDRPGRFRRRPAVPVAADRTGSGGLHVRRGGVPAALLVVRGARPEPR